MNFELEVIPFLEVIKNRSLKYKLSRLTLTEDSGLSYELYCASVNPINYTEDDVVILCKTGNRIIGWGLLLSRKLEDSYYKDYFWNFGVFVKETYRGKGAGTLISKKAIEIKKCEFIHVEPWDTKGCNLFKKVGLTVKKFY